MRFLHVDEPVLPTLVIGIMHLFMANVSALCFDVSVETPICLTNDKYLTVEDLSKGF